MAKKQPVKKRIRDAGVTMTVWPCKRCGRYPVWGSAFLLCPKRDVACFETGYDDPKGSAVREWNLHNKPKGS